MSLRQEVIEVLRLADHDYTRVDPKGKAGYQLDALLGFLKENADEWLYEAAIAQPAVGIARKLLNILSDTEEE